MLTWLTPEERRGGVVLVLILVLGAGHDAWVARRMRHELETAPARAPSSAQVHGDSASSPASGFPAEPAARAQGRLDVNRATAGELEALPGIGPVLARRIVEARRQMGGFARIEDLLGVRGVGPRLFARLRPLLVVTPMHSAASASRGLADSASAGPVSSR